MTVARRRAASCVLAIAGWLLVPAAPFAAPQDAETLERLRFEAAQLAQDGDLEGALQKYELLSEQFPEAPEATEALLRIVIGNRDLGRGDAAEEAARKLIRTHPRSLQAAGAYTLLGRLQVEAASDREALEEARVTFENAVLLYPRAGYPRQPWRAEAAVRGAQVALRLGRDAEAARALADVIDLERRSLWTATARLELAALLLDQDDWPQAGELLQEIVDGAGESAGERALAASAGSRLTLIHRLGLRPAAGQPRWQGARLVGAGERPVSVAAREDGRLAVTAGKGSTVVLDLAGQTVGRWTHEEAARTSWWGDELVVATTESAATFPGRRNLRFAAPPSEKKPTVRPLVAVEEASFGRWFVLAAKPARVLLYEPERRLHKTLVAGKGIEPVDLARDRRGRLLVLDRRRQTVTRFSAAGEAGERLIAGGWEQAAALSVDPVGNIYVLDRERGQIEVFDRHGERLVGLGPSLPGGIELQRPADLAVDSAGRLWIADTRQGLIVLE